MQEVIYGLVVVGSIIYAANIQQVHQDRGKIVSGLLIILSLLGIIIGAMVLFAAIEPTFADNGALRSQVDLPPIEIPVALVFIILSLVLGMMSIAVVVSHKVRLWVAHYIIRSNQYNRRYNPDSIVHTTAIVIALFQILNVIGGFILAGGIEGLAEQFASSGLSFDLLIGSLITNLLVALLGVGLFIRRNVRQTLERLGLNTITPSTLLMGAVIGFSVFWVVFGLSSLWTLIVSPETLAEQSSASEQLFLLFSGSFIGGLMLAATAAIGEEILFRGALQPIFGIFWTSIFFAILHTQYTLTPAVLLIFGVSLAFGWVRERYGTAAAILAHFVYNFIPFLLFWSLGQVVLESTIR
jgi:uncharacterized protein